MKYFGLIFALPFIGGPIALLTILWGDNGFGSPPVAMQLFGSFVCIAVAAAGFMMAIGIIRGKQLSPQKRHAESSPSPKGLYSCSHCGASIGEDSEISPSGDIKCEYCKSWFNVNKK